MRCPAHDHVSASLSAFRSEVDNVVGAFDDVPEREAVGEYALYDLKPFKIDAGYFEVRADGLKASRSVQLK